MQPEIILASSSSVRKEVLDRLRVIYNVFPSEFAEKMSLEADESFEDLAKRMASGKAREVASKVKNAVVIGADSFAVFDGNIMGKPHTKKVAIEFLEQLSGRTHEFYTGMAVIDTEIKKEIVDCTKARVHFRHLSQEEIKQYVDREEVETAAAAYRIQSLGAMFVDWIEGDYYAVVGFSPSKLHEMFGKLGRNIFDYIPSLA